MTETVGEQLKTVPFHAIEVELYSRKTNKATQLVNNTDMNLAIDAKRTWHQFDLNEPVFVQEIEVSASGYENWHAVEFEIENTDGSKHIESVNFNGTSSKLKIGKLAKSFRIRPAERFSLIASTKLISVIVTGLTLEEFNAFEWALKEIESREKKVALDEATYSDLKEDVEKKIIERNSLSSEIGKSRGELEQLGTGLTGLKTEISKAEIDFEASAEKGKLLRDDNIRMAKENNESEFNLNQLKNEIKLFPSEIAGFVKEGNRSIKWYFWLGLPFAIIIGFVTFSLFFSAVDLTQLWKNEGQIDIWTVFLTRIPFVLVALTILEVCGYVVGRLVFEIIKINRQRLSLSKLSIVAKDVSNAALHDEDTTVDDRYERQVRLKMELLREHMKEYVGQEFQYRGTLIATLFSALVNKASIQKD